MVKVSKKSKYSKYIGNSEKYFPYQNFMIESEDNCENFLISAGFEIIDSQIVHTEYSSPHYEDILKAFQGINPMQSDLPEELLETFYEDYRKESKKHNFITDSLSIAPYSILICYARKAT